MTGDEEVQRLATLLGDAKYYDRVNNDGEIVRFILDQYHPRIEWEEFPPDPRKEYETDPAERKFAYFGRLRARVRVGGKIFSFVGMLHPRMSQAEIHRKYKDHIRTRVGREIAEWMDGEKG